MAERDSIAFCTCCGSEFKQSGKGRPAKRCQACRQNSAAYVHSVPHKTCNRCGAPLGKGRYKWCSTECKDGTKMTRAEYRQSVKAKPDSTCEQCGAAYKSNLGGLSLARGHKSRFCSRECLAKHREAVSAPKFSPVFLLVCRVCDRRFYSKNRLRQHCSDGCRKATGRNSARESYLRRANVDRSPRKCKCCGNMFEPAYGNKKREFCSAACAKRFSSRLRGKNHRRRARSYGVTYEPVNPIAVFERDGWRCKLCGVKTPKRLRGTLDPSAPELDHIIPLSKGGAHSYENTHCACRKCNGNKGDRPLGQLLLIG